MTFLPIVGRELRVAARRRGTYWSRAASALGAIVVGVFLQVASRNAAPSEFGQTLFQVLAWISIFYCLIAGVRSTADCVSEEKREGTLGLLFLTDLKGYDVVLGKLAATSVGAFYGLLAIFPVLAIPLLMGGITNAEFWRMTLVLVNTFLFSLAAGIFISSISKSARKAMAGTFVLLLIFTVVLPGIVEWVPKLSRMRKLEHAVFMVWPFSPFQLSFDAVYVTNKRDFWWSSGLLHGFTWLFLILASLITPRSWQDKAAGAGVDRWRERWHRWSFGSELERNAFRKRLLDINAFYWLAGRARLKPAHVWAFLGIVACFWAWGCVEVGRDWFNEGIYIFTGIFVNTCLKLWVASEAGRRMGEDRKAGALELLLSTPLGVRDILRGQWLALRRQFLAPVLLVLAIEFTFLAAGARTDARGDSTYLAFWILYMVMLVCDLVALSWVGMWVALTTRNPNRATSITVVRLLVFPWIGWIGLFIVGGVMGAANGDSAPQWLLGLWFVLGLAADLAFGINARWQLHNSFRIVAMERFTPGKTGWRQWFGRSATPAPNLPPVVAS